MRQTATHINQRPRWTHCMALERRYGLPRGMLSSNAANGDSMVKRMLGTARLYSATLNQLAGILSITVRDRPTQI